MSATLASKPNSPLHSIRPVNLRTDLAQLADLLELCFIEVMDESGRAGLREMRMVSESQALSTIYEGVDRLLGGLEMGFVWLENERIVGNVSISPANYPLALGNGFIIANVAVHPDVRRQGIAESLLRRAMTFIQDKGGTFAVLQVNPDNSSSETATRLYQRAGFRTERTFTRWSRRAQYRTPARLDNLPFMTIRSANEWQSEYKLVETVRPNALGGLGWLRPTHPRYFRKNIFITIFESLIGITNEHWIIRDTAEAVIGAVHIHMPINGADRLDLFIHPSTQGQFEEALLNTALRRLEGRTRSISIEHPHDDTLTSELLRRYGFELKQTLIHMRYDF